MSSAGLAHRLAGPPTTKQGLEPQLSSWRAAVCLPGPSACHEGRNTPVWSPPCLSGPVQGLRMCSLANYVLPSPNQSSRKVL